MVTCLPHNEAQRVTAHVIRQSISVPVLNTAVLYSIGEQIGGILTITPTGIQLGTGITIEQVAIVDTEHLEPDLDIFFFNDIPSNSTFGDNTYQTMNTLDKATPVGAVSIRSASSNWKAFYSAAATKSWSVATVNPYFSFNLGSLLIENASKQFQVMVQAASAVTYAGVGSLTMTIVYRQG